GLADVAWKVVFNPAMTPTLLGEDLQAVAGEVKCRVTMAECRRSHLALRRLGLAFWHCPCGLVSLRLPHQVQPAQTFTQSSIVNVARGIEGYGTSMLVCLRGLQRQFNDEGRLGLAWHRCRNLYVILRPSQHLVYPN